MRRALVFAGGGSKGAYEYGVWKALRELGEEFDLSVGTSIGSINAGFYVQKDFDAAGELWTEMNLDTVMKNGINFEKSVNYMLEQRDNIGPFLKSYFKDNAGADITPFINCIEKYANEERFFASEIDYALVTVKSKDLQPVEIYKKDIKPGYLTKWITASCACFPAFPRCEIDGQFYIDGGFYDNLPIATAIKMGCDDIVAVDLRPTPTHPGYAVHPNVKYLKPSRELGSFLRFERKVLDELITLGYNDTMRSYGKITGNIFYIKDSQEDKINRTESAKKFIKHLTRTEIMYESARQSIKTRPWRSCSLLKILAGDAENKTDADTLFLNALELALDKADSDKDKVYSYYEMLDEFKSKYIFIRDISQLDLGETAEAIRKQREDKKGLFAELKHDDPESEDYIIALLANILYKD